MADRHRATDTLDGARLHARGQATAEPAQEPGVPEGVVRPIWREVVAPGNYASCRLPRGAMLRITDPDGDACVQLLVHNARQPSERLNVADTVKVQWQAYLGNGAVLLSDLGRALMTIVADSSERHDCLCGCTNRATAATRGGDASASGPSPNGRDLLALGVAKLGLERRDVGPCVNLFKSVRVADDGTITLDGHPAPGAAVDLRADMDVLVTLANTPHPLDDRDGYVTSTVTCVAWQPCAAVGDADVGGEPVTTTPERQRAYQNTAAFLAQVAG
ncbi:MAG: DUF1989 domain-containing protein [Ilumatobacteraceae bacterium]